MKNLPSATTTTNTLIILRAEVFLPALSFLLPFLVSGPQWLTGTLVNTVILLSFTKLTRRQAWPVLVLPGLGALAHGMLFGPFTPFLLFFLPFIWTGNALFVECFLRLRERSGIVAVIVGALLKSAWLFLFARLLFRLAIVPGLFVQSMGVLQLITALCGGVIALGILRFSVLRRQ